MCSHCAEWSERRAVHAVSVDMLQRDSSRLIKVSSKLGLVPATTPLGFVTAGGVTTACLL